LLNPALLTHISRGIKTSAKGASNPDSANHHPTSKHFENSPEYYDDKNKKIRGISENELTNIKQSHEWFDSSDKLHYARARNEVKNNFYKHETMRKNKREVIFQ